MVQVVTVEIRRAAGELASSAISVRRRAASRSTTTGKGRRMATEIRQASPSSPLQMSSRSLNTSSFPPVATTTSRPIAKHTMAKTPIASRRRRHSNTPPVYAMGTAAPATSAVMPLCVCGRSST